MYVYVDWATRVSCYIISNPTGNMDLNSDWTAVPCAATTTRQTDWVKAPEPKKKTKKKLTFTFIVLWFFFVFFRNCLRLPDDMYSVMNITCGTRRGHFKDVCLHMCGNKERERCLTRAWVSFMSSQYLWNLTMFGCSTCIRFSNISLIFSYKTHIQASFTSWLDLMDPALTINQLPQEMFQYFWYFLEWTIN